MSPCGKSYWISVSRVWFFGVVDGHREHSSALFSDIRAFHFPDPLCEVQVSTRLVVRRIYRPEWM